MEKSPLGVGVIGMGDMGRPFAEILRQLPAARLVGVSDIAEQAEPDRRRRAGEHGGDV